MKLRQLFNSGMMCGDNKYTIDLNGKETVQENVYSGEVKEEYLNHDICEEGIEHNGNDILITIEQ